MQSNRTVPRRRELILVAAGQVSLPLLEVDWREDAPVGPEQRPGRVTDKGYHSGRAPAHKGKTFPPTPPTPEEVLAILAAFPMNTIVGRRNHAHTVFLWRTGLRIAESLDLIPADVDLANHIVTVRCGKGGKRRLVGIDLQACRVLTEWLDERAYLGCRPHEPVFCVTQESRRGRRQWCSTYREALQEAARRAGIDKRIHPHGLRHALAVELSRERIPVPMISKQLGHSNVATTSTYLQGISPQEVVDIMSARSWPGAPDA